MTKPSRDKATGRRTAASGSRGKGVSVTHASGETLSALMDDITSGLTAGAALPASLDERLSRLQRAAHDRLQAKLTEPIADSNDFVARLRQVNKTYKRGLLTRQLAKACANLHDYIAGRDLRQKPEYYKIHTLIYETNDSLHFDDKIVEWAKHEGRELLARLQDQYGGRKSAGDGLQKNRRLLREQVLFITCYGNELKRAGEIDKAVEVFEWLYEFTSKMLMNEEVKCCATLGNLSYHLGALRRLREEHVLAEAMYLRALNHYYDRAKARQGDPDDFFFVTRRIAMCIGPGLGWVNLTRGALRRAEHALATARALMVHISDPVVRASIDMMYGTIKRTRAGTDRAGLAEAIEMLSDAHRVFEENENNRYVTRVRWELSLAYNLLSDFEQAEEHLDFVEAGYRGGPNMKWRANVHILRSRIRRNQGRHQESLTEAQAAFELAQAGELLLPSVDALIARGEAVYHLAESTDRREFSYEKALNDFLKALAMLKSKGEDGDAAEPTRNPKIAAACAIHAAACYIKIGRWKDADEYLKKWEMLRPFVEHEWLREKARSVEKNFKQMTRDFTVSANNPGEWDYTEKLDELRLWFRTQALKQTGGNWKRAAELLDVTPNTLRTIKPEKGGTKGAGKRRRTK